MALKKHEAPQITDSPGIRSLNEALKIFFWVLKWVMLATLVAFLFSGVFVVEQNRVGLKLRFGRITGAMNKRVLGPGIHFAFPYPVDEVVEIEAGKTRTMQVDNFWYSQSLAQAIQKVQGRASSATELVPGRDGYAITGDANILHFKWLVRYRVDEPLDYFMNLAQASDGSVSDDVASAAGPFIEAAVTNAVVQKSSTITVDDFVINTNAQEKKIEFKDAVTAKAQEILDTMDSGIHIEGIDYEGFEVPSGVAEAFSRAQDASNQSDRLISEAESYRNQVLRQAQGTAAEIRGRAQADKNKVITSARADSEYINTLLKRYPRDTGKLDVYLRQHYLEAINEVLTNAESKYIVDKQGDIWLKISKDPKELEPKEEEGS